MEDSYKEYIKEKYLVENPTILNNPAILKMIFALEWYDVPRTCYSELIEMHPYLTRGDYEKLQQLDSWHTTENTISWLLFSMMSNRLIMTKSSPTSLLRRRTFARLPLAMIFGGVLTYAMNLAVLRPLYLNEINEYKLSDKYFFLDLNADMMREDLKQMGINIEAKHFDMDLTERRMAQEGAQDDKNTK
jgi:hypothetical protein